MAKKCSHCGCFIEDNEKVFCPNCGEFIDKELNLINKLDKTLDNYDKTEHKTQTPKQPEAKKATKQNKYDDDDEEVTKLHRTQSSGNGLGKIVIVIVIIVVIAVVLKMFLF